MSADRQTQIDQQDARQGKTGVGVRYMLAGGLILVILAFAIIYLVMR